MNFPLGTFNTSEYRAILVNDNDCLFDICLLIVALSIPVISDKVLGLVIPLSCKIFKKALFKFLIFLSLQLSLILIIFFTFSTFKHNI